MIGRKMIRNKLHFFVILLQRIVVVSIALLFLPAVFQIYPNVVLSGSMEPEIPTGSLAYVYTRYPIDRIRSGDIVEYEVGNGMEILHRVVDVNEIEKYLKTKGDANANVDLGTVSFEQYRGKLLMVVPYAGYVVSFFRNKYVIMGILGICMVHLLEELK